MRNRAARIAGALYVLSIAVGIVAWRILPDRFYKPGDAAGTAHAIVANEFLFRLTMVSDLAGGVVWLAVVLALYRLFADVDKLQANLMVVLGAFMQVPLYFVNVLNYVAALMLVSGSTAYLAAFSSAQRAAMAMLFLRLHHYEILASLVFAGLWLVPFGVLVYKSRFLPRFLGVWLFLNAAAWLVVCLGGFLAPHYGDAIDTLTMPFQLGEIVTALWLLVLGDWCGRLSPSVASATRPTS